MICHKSQGTVGENIIATNKIRDNYGDIQSFIHRKVGTAITKL